MKVKALCTIKDGTCTYNAGDIFETEEDLGNLVEVVEAQSVTEATKEVEATEVTEAPKPKSNRKRKISE